MERDSRSGRRRIQRKDSQSLISAEDGTQIERTRSGRRRTIRKTADKRETLNQMKNFCTATIGVGVQGLLKEFNEIRATSVPPSKLVKTAFDRNPDKNRYKDVFCVDETRVVLNFPPDGNDYIHANWVDVVSTKRRFICTQNGLDLAAAWMELQLTEDNSKCSKAPKENTVDDFWRMVWQENSHSIIMLCNIIECGKKKCEQYWPATEGESKDYGLLKVKCNKVVQEEKMLTISVLTITDGTNERNVEHIAWNDWPDRGVPNNFLAPFRLLQRIKNQIHVVIHCSAGIGRTGTIVGLDVAEAMFNNGMKVNMRDIVRELRLQRHGSVQTDIQYVYIHRCIMALSENKKIVNKEAMASFVKDFDAIARERGGMAVFGRPHGP